MMPMEDFIFSSSSIVLQVEVVVIVVVFFFNFFLLIIGHRYCLPKPKWNKQGLVNK